MMQFHQPLDERIGGGSMVDVYRAVRRGCDVVTPKRFIVREGLPQVIIDRKILLQFVAVVCER